jgi:uncharacterized protein (TIGR02246 family)
VPAAEVDRRLGIVQRRFATDDGWRSRFNNIYTASNGGFSTEPNALLVSTVQGLPKGTALDIGMGQGRNTLYLARQGWSVTGIDLSDLGIAQAKRAAQEAGLRINTVQQSYADFDFGDSRWDLILLAYEPLPAADAQWVDRIQRALRPGGLVVVETFAADTSMPARPPVALDPLRLRDAYQTQFNLQRFEIVTATADWGLQKTPLVRMVAQKPSPSAVHSDDRAVRRIVSDLWQAWNTHQPKLIVKDFSADHDHVNVFGGWHEDTASLLAMYERNFAPGGQWDKSGPFIGAGVLNLRFVRPDVAVAIVGAVERAHPGAMTSTWVFNKQDGRWAVTNFHNTADLDPLGLPSRQAAPRARATTVMGVRSAEGEGAVQKVIADFWTAWNQHDAKALVRDFSDDHQHINVFAGFCHWIQRQGVFADQPADLIQMVYARAHRSDGVFGQSQVKNATLEKLRFLRPDVVVAIVETTWHDNNRSRSTWVLSKEAGRWLVRSFQITAQMDLSKMPPP